MTLELVRHSIVLLMVAVAAFTDLRTGHIPNWVTLPGLFIGPLLSGIDGALQGFLGSVLGLVACGIVPYVLFRQDAIGGGDVKLFAAIGAFTGVRLGLEIEFFSFVAAALFSMGVLAFKGKLVRTLANAVFIMFNPILPRKWRREVKPELTSMVRLGAAILAATLFVGFNRYASLLTL